MLSSVTSGSLYFSFLYIFLFWERSVAIKPYLFDLDVDPNELNNLYSLPQYQSIISSLSDRVKYWETQLLSPQSPPSTDLAPKAWKTCGGICPWLQDDPTFKPVNDSQIYHYNNAPNIVFVFVDDWGWNDVGWRSTYLSWTTPTIDSLASEGVKLDNYYTHYSCVPTRGAFLTGRYPVRLGLWEDQESAELPLTETTIAQELRSAGYRTYLVGKWHQGYSTPDHLPNNRGFDSYYGFLNGFTDYWTKKYGSDLDLHDNYEIGTDSSETSQLLHNGYLLQTKAEAAIADHAKNYPNQPMFLYYAMQLIHGNWSAPDRFLERCAIPTIDDAYKLDVEHNYCALNAMLDEAIANLTCTLKASNIHDNTIMVVVSDNGGERTVTGNNYPFFWRKRPILARRCFGYWLHPQSLNTR